MRWRKVRNVGGRFEQVHWRVRMSEEHTLSTPEPILKEVDYLMASTVFEGSWTIVIGRISHDRDVRWGPERRLLLET